MMASNTSERSRTALRYGCRPESASYQAQPAGSVFSSSDWAEKASRWSCCICTGELKEARLLVCLHSVCLSCIRRNGQDGCVGCPKCLLITSLQELNKPDYLAHDYLSYQMLGNNTAVLTCDECGDDEPAVCRCMECLQFLCSLHKAAHRKSKNTNSHTLTDLSQLLSSAASECPSSEAAIETVSKSDKLKLDLSAARTRLVCGVHAGMKELELYCRSCRQCICRDCIVVDHKTHDYVFVKDARVSMDVLQHVSTLDEWEMTLGKTVESVTAAERNLADNFQSASLAIEKAEMEMKMMVEDRCRQLLKDVDTMYDTKSRLLEKQKGDLIRLREQLSFSSSFAKFTSENGSDIQCLFVQDAVDSRSELLAAEASKQACVPLTDGSLTVHIDAERVAEVLKSIGRVTSNAVAVMSEVELPEQCYFGSAVNVSIRLVDAANRETTAIPGNDVQVKMFGPMTTKNSKFHALQKVDGALLTNTTSNNPAMVIYSFRPPAVGRYQMWATMDSLPMTTSNDSITVTKPPLCFDPSWFKRKTGSLLDGVRFSDCNLSVTLEPGLFRPPPNRTDLSIFRNASGYRYRVFCCTQLFKDNGSWNIEFNASKEGAQHESGSSESRKKKLPRGRHSHHQEHQQAYYAAGVAILHCRHPGEDELPDRLSDASSLLSDSIVVYSSGMANCMSNTTYSAREFHADSQYYQQGMHDARRGLHIAVDGASAIHDTPKEFKFGCGEQISLNYVANKSIEITKPNGEYVYITLSESGTGEDLPTFLHGRMARRVTDEYEGSNAVAILPFVMIAENHACSVSLSL